MKIARYLTVDSLDIAKRIDNKYEFIDKQEETILTSPTGEEYILPERYLVKINSTISRRTLCRSTGIRKVRTA